MKFGSGPLHFLVLDQSWAYACCVLLSFLCSALLAIVAYTLLICGCAILALGVSMHNSTVEYELEKGEDLAPQWKLSMRFAAAHIVTIGFGTVLPTSEKDDLLAILQQIAGMLQDAPWMSLAWMFLNIFVFTAVNARLQKPEADIVWLAVSSANFYPSLQRRSSI